MPESVEISDGRHRIEFLSWQGCTPFPIVMRKSQADGLPKGLVVCRLGLVDIKAKTFVPD